jgi:hypothetical protein
VSEWTLSTLKEHFEALRTADKEALDAALTTANTALEVLAENQRAYRDQQNEWRGTINDILAQNRGTKTGARELWGYLVGALALAFAIYKSMGGP